MAIQSQEEFFSILEKSNLLDADQFLAARQSVEGLDDATQTARQLVRDGFLTRWQAAQLLAGRSSFLLGKYKLLDLLGRGGMGRVFLGRHVTMQRHVALKIVSRDIASNPAALERFLAEARAIAALDHPAIVQAYSVDCEGERYYIVMEYVDGRDLQQVVEDDGPLPWPTAVEYIRQAADGLAHAHGRNLVHCDIKPSNLLVNRQGQVKILDMGMARLGGDHDEVKDGAPLLGSVDYLAPEQALGAETFDHRADLYSLGCTLYFLLTGHAPFPEGTLPERILKHQTQQPRPIPTERPDVPPALVQICRRMMAKQPEDRFQSADEIGAALAELPATADAPAKPLDAESRNALPTARAANQRGGDHTAEPAAVPPDPIEQLQHWVTSAAGRFVLGGGIVLALLLVAGISIAIVAARGPAPPAPEEPAEVAQPSAPPAKPEKEKPEEEDPFDLARAFAKRVKAGSEAPATEPSEGEPGAPTDPPPSDPAKTAPESSPPAPPASDSPPEEPASPGKQPPDTTSPEVAAPGDAAKDAAPEQTPPAKSPPKEPAPAKTPPAKTPPAKTPPDKPKPPKNPQPSPFRDLGKRIPLKPVQPGEKMSLGKLHLAPSQPLRMELVGGQTAWKGPRDYVIDRPDPDKGPWLLSLRSEAPGDEKAITDLAMFRFAADGQELEIEWLKQADAENVQPLRNCALAVRAGDETAWLEFGAPEIAEPLILDLAKRSWRATLISESLPAAESLGVQVTRVEGDVPKVEFKPGDTVKEGERMEIQLAKLEAAQVKLNLNFAMQGRAIRVDVAPRFAIDGVGEWPFSLRDVRRVAEQLATQRAQLELVWKALPENSPNRQEIAEKRSKLDKIIGAVARIVEMAKNDEKTTIYYRVFTTAGERQIELWTTEDAEANKSGANSDLSAAERFFGLSWTPTASRMPNRQGY